MADPFSFLANSSASRKPQLKNSSLDAFQDLVSFGTNATANKQTIGLTLAERAARDEQGQKSNSKKDTDTHISIPVQSSFWDKFDSSSTPAPGNNEWNLDFLAPSSSNRNQTYITPVGESWDIDSIYFKSSKTKSQTTSGRQPLNLLDSDDFSPLVDFTGSSQPSILIQSNTPGSFDFDDDILGDLGKPVEVVRNKVSMDAVLDETIHQSLSRNSPLPRDPSSSSPPPHVLGQLIEMGFSIQQSKQALAKTSSGVDVDAAIEILLRDTVNTPLEELDGISPESNRRQFPSTHASHSSKPLPPNDTAQAFQEQADKLLAQASSIGLNMFNKANILWKESREKVAKVYEEQRQGISGKQNRTTNSTVPRWMDPSPGNQISTTSDIAGSQTTAYKSPARHRIAGITSLSSPSLSTSNTPPSSSRTSPVPISLVSLPPPQPPVIIRPYIEVSASTLALSNAAKEKGTEHFRLGQFAEAESSYSRALEALPKLHLSRVPLHNNRALARIKIGKYKSSIEDSSMVIQIVTEDLGSSWHPGREPQGGATLAEAVSKAYRRRAEAYEGLEKWTYAKTDWETLNSLPWVELSSKQNAVNGITRCKRMLTNDMPKQLGTPASFTTTVRTVKSRPTAMMASISSEGTALSRVRAANLVHEREDQERHELKDSIDARLETWRSGKEQNVRALIASLETILPTRFSWQKVGMAELVTNNQVKARYMKAIARLHPDKLSASDISVEERMIANGVFGTLNEAWNSFR
ncbi:hypothetical protein Clacol_005781 [Clathrus columnatus]|uniref:UBA domain-containing protein n=1 Tax=Clathrus columnatus TaxID=1419009 RepID=A0AAV5AD69_9AGAM|nr:hypothetical protein Clacol_005781 [Clathrus columnatus]